MLVSLMLTVVADTVFEGDLPRRADLGFRVDSELSVRSVVEPTELDLREGDVVIRVNGTDASRARLERLPGGAPVRLEVRRGGATHVVRFEPRPLAPENVPGVETIYGVLEAADGARLRTIVTKPDGSDAPGPAVLFIDWLSCNTVEVPASNRGGWAEMIRGVITRSGLVVMRTDKRGVGDSSGPPCSELDYETNLAHHKDALRKLLSYPFVDPDRIVIFGASMGGNMAPLVALEHDVAGVIVWGGGARTWHERMMAFERNFRERSGTPGAEMVSDMKRLTRFFYHYLVEQKDPEAIGREIPDLAGVWGEEVRGSGGRHHYGRPFEFHQQAQQQNWAAAWAKLRVPTLVMFGEYDWFEDAGGHELIARLVNQNAPGNGRYVLLPRMNHHFEIYSSPERAVPEDAYEIGAMLAVDTVVDWLDDTVLGSR